MFHVSYKHGLLRNSWVFNAKTVHKMYQGA